jgi:hypothetical protein
VIGSKDSELLWLELVVVKRRTRTHTADGDVTLALYNDRGADPTHSLGAEAPLLHEQYRHLANQ